MERLRAAGCVYAEDEARLLAEVATGESLERLVRRRVGGEPLEHLLGWVQFGGLRLAVGPGVFVPRSRTQVLVDVALEHVSGADAPLVVEVCCGVAPVGSAVLAARPDAVVHAADLDARALVHARTNLGPAAGVWCGDLLRPLPAGLRGRVDVLVANAPYVPTHAIALMPPEARDHEPHHTLDGGSDGADLHRRIAGEAASWLAPDGLVAVETGREQADTTVEALTRAGLETSVRFDDEVDGTAVLARRPR
ncbi:putative protein N(5)-glutamine methyltransferase [Aeromicrobium sp. Root495]|uniref:putative protein N(5)-glutamine methyltransferase n=1 Tax=Aeromicrobium sp. Root495 TaxID=1736550 RepID=UPI002286B9D7|nr:putative protein N(5)-glutamine methyltransferase [Aeromicrobium sp. Root495]